MEHEFTCKQRTMRISWYGEMTIVLILLATVYTFLSQPFNLHHMDCSQLHTSLYITTHAHHHVSPYKHTALDIIYLHTFFHAHILCTVSTTFSQPTDTSSYTSTHTYKHCVSNFSFSDYGDMKFFPVRGSRVPITMRTWNVPMIRVLQGCYTSTHKGTLMHTLIHPKQEYAYNTHR